MARAWGKVLHMKRIFKGTPFRDHRLPVTDCISSLGGEKDGLKKPLLSAASGNDEEKMSLLISPARKARHISDCAELPQESMLNLRWTSAFTAKTWARLAG
jgi:hypothetical protein